MKKQKKEYNEGYMELVVHQGLKSEFDQTFQVDEAQNARNGFLGLLIGNFHCLHWFIRLKQ